MKFAQLLLAAVLFFAALTNLFLPRDWADAEAIPVPKPFVPKPPVVCQVCHCGKSSCHRECGEDAMCRMRCEKLCHKDKHATDADLAAWFKWDNDQYFRSQLPETIVRWEPALDAIDVMGRTRKVNGVFIIMLSPRLNLAEPTMRLTILHEACHVETWDEDLEHGNAWQACRNRLISNGAVDDLF